MSILELKQVEKRIENHLLFPAFDLTCRKGETIALCCNTEIGHTLIRMILGEVPVAKGKIERFGGNSSREEFKQRVGLSLQNEAVYERLTPKEYLKFFSELYNIPADIDEILESVGLYDKKRIRSSSLSYSEKKRLQFARTILHHPDLIILEEPTQNLDVESTIILHRLISELEAEGKTVFITTSNLENAISLSSHVYRLNEDGLKKMELEEEIKPDDREFPKEEEATVNNEGEVESLLTVQFDKIPAKIEDKLILFDPTEIDFIESNSGVSNMNVKGETFPCSFTLSDLEKRLQPFGFFRCHRSYIVNLQKVREVITWTRNSYSLVLDDTNKSSIPLSKGKLDELKSILGI